MNHKHGSSDLGREQKGIHRGFEGPITTNHYTKRLGQGAVKGVTGSLLGSFSGAGLARTSEMFVIAKILGIMKSGPQRKGRRASFRGQ
jgi:hypothetical protein